MLEIFKDIFQIFFAVIGSFVALTGLRAWKIQLKGKSEYELAKRLLKNIYSIRQRIEWFRNPIIMADEIFSARKALFTSDKEYDDRNDSRIVYSRRWNDIVEIYSELNVAKIESEVSWGKEISNELDRLRQLLTELKISLQGMLDLQRKDNLPENVYIYLAEYEAVVYDRSAEKEPDDFSKKLNGIIKRLEELISPHLK